MQIHDALQISERALILPSLQKKVYDFFQTRKDLVFETGIHSGIFHVLLLPLILSDNEQTDRKTLVIIPAPDDVEGFRKQNGGIAATTPERIIDGLRRGTDGFQEIKRFVIACPGEEICAAFAADIQFIYSRLETPPHTLVFTEKLHKGLASLKKLLLRPKIIGGKDIIILKNNQENTQVSTEDIQDFIHKIGREVYKENAGVLRMYRKLFTKNISLFNRINVAAYLLKQAIEKQKQENPPQFRGESRNQQRGLPHTNMKMLFFGLGKNRKIFPKDICGIILNKFPEMDKNDIGDIRILDSYSFVEVAENQAQTVIEALNGTGYRGKILAVNYARKKEAVTK